MITPEQLKEWHGEFHGPEGKFLHGDTARIVMALIGEVERLRGALDQVQEDCVVIEHSANERFKDLDKEFGALKAELADAYGRLKESRTASRLYYEQLEKAKKALNNCRTANPYPDLSYSKYVDAFRFIERHVEETLKELGE